MSCPREEWPVMDEHEDDPMVTIGHGLEPEEEGSIEGGLDDTSRGGAEARVIPVSQKAEPSDLDSLIPSPVEVYRTDANEEVERMAAEFERQIEAEQALWRPVIEAGNP